MPEFKVNENISGEIRSFRSSGEEIQGSDLSAENATESSLKTSSRYIEENNRIKELFDLYKQLIKKDASDLDKMVETAQILDSTNAGKLR